MKISNQKLDFCRIIIKGYSRVLIQTDLWSLDEPEQSQHIYENFIKWHNRMKQWSK